LDYADDICLLVQRFCDIEEKLKRLKEEAESAGLYININKTKGIRNDGKEENQLDATITVY
jgi:hypothetical protein